MKDKIIGAIISLLIGALSAGLVVWRNDAVRAEQVAQLRKATDELDKVVRRLESSVAVLDERSRKAEPEKQYVRVIDERR